jgi:hypothetical protein
MILQGVFLKLSRRPSPRRPFAAVDGYNRGPPRGHTQPDGARAGRVLSAAVPPLSIKHALVLLCTPLLAVGVSACASTTSGSFKGEPKAIAQTISDLQTEATAGEAKKICDNLLASVVTARLSSAPGGCTQAIKSQLSQVDTLELTVQSILPQTATTASAKVKNTYAGKAKISTVELVKEDGKWKISKLS